MISAASINFLIVSICLAVEVSTGDVAFVPKIDVVLSNPDEYVTLLTEEETTLAAKEARYTIKAANTNAASY